MKKALFLFLVLLFPFCSFAASFVHPGSFKGTKTERKQVINFIQQSVKKTYTKIGMGDPATLRMMEKEELSSFKKLLGVKNKPLLNHVVTQYCQIGMCNYNTIWMMYNEQNKASKETLAW